MSKYYKKQKLKKRYRQATTCDEVWSVLEEFIYPALAWLCDKRSESMSGAEIANRLRTLDRDSADLVGYDREVEQGFGIQPDWFRYVIVQVCNHIAKPFWYLPCITFPLTSTTSTNPLNQ